MVCMAFGEKIEFWGKNKFGSLTGLASALDISLQNLSQYVNNKIEPGAKILKKLRKLECDLNWLFDESGSLVKEDTKTIRDLYIKNALSEINNSILTSKIEDNKTKIEEIEKLVGILLYKINELKQSSEN